MVDLTYWYLQMHDKFTEIPESRVLRNRNNWHFQSPWCLGLAVSPSTTVWILSIHKYGFTMFINVWWRNCKDDVNLYMHNFVFFIYLEIKKTEVFERSMWFSYLSTEITFDDNAIFNNILILKFILNIICYHSLQ